MLPPRQEQYVQEVANRLRAALGDDLLAVFLVGSAALGDWVPERSDIDVMAVCAGPLSAAQRDRLVESLLHRALPCPARGLELVVYPLSIAGSGSGEPGFELNLNTGAEMAFRVDEQPGEIEGFWFALDRSILRERGLALAGPPPADLFAPIPRPTVLGLLADSVRWHRDSGIPLGSDVVLNTCRALRFAAEGTWSSKREAGAWAAGEPAVRAALAGDALDREAVERFLDAAEARLDDVLGQA